MIDRSLGRRKQEEPVKKPQKKKKTLECYFVRSPNYAEAVKEAMSLKAEGWTPRNWHYEATTMRFVILLTRPEGYKKPEEAKEENNKESTDK